MLQTPPADDLGNRLPILATENDVIKPKLYKSMQLNHCRKVHPIKRLFSYKTILVMKLTTFILLVACMQVSATAFSQRITLSEKNAPLKNVLDKIRLQSGYSLFYDKDLISKAPEVNIQLSNATVEQSLDALLKNQQLAWLIVDQTIVIKLKEPSLLDKLKSVLQIPVTIKGRVLNEEGQPLVGATVKIKGQNIVASTDLKGEFSLNTGQGNATLQITYIGYEPMELVVNTKDEIQIIHLVKSLSKLDEVHVIAYGTTTERLSTGNVTTVSAKQIESQPVSNPLLALQGNVPGLFITQGTGMPGTSVGIKIEGQNSIANGTDPLYVIDGVPYGAQSGMTINTFVQTGYAVNQSGQVPPSPLNFINPGDIESISVLKDADATSIYGSRAANGAILITTKKGKAGQTKIDFNLQSGYGRDTRREQLLNTQQYLEMRTQALANGGISAPRATDYDLNGVYNTNSYTDWQKVLIGGTAHYTNLQGSVSGGSANTQFLVSTNYHRETTVFPGDFADQKGSLHFSLNNTSDNKKFRFQFSGSYLYDGNRIPSFDVTRYSLYLAPNAPSNFYNTDGTINWAPNSNGGTTWLNPVEFLAQPQTIKTGNLISNMVIGYELLPGLVVKSSLGYTNTQDNEVLLQPANTFRPELVSPNMAQFGNSNLTSWIIEPQVTYYKVLGKGRLEAIVGQTIQRNDALGQTFTASGFSSVALLGDIGSASSLSGKTSIASVYRYNAGFFRVNYNWDDKYIVNIAARRDGSSRFGSANQFHDFGSVGTAWIFSKESFMQSFDFISFGKLRASYGTTGNDQIGDYNFLSMYRNSNSYAPTSYQGVTGLYPQKLTNPYLQWEATRKTNIGLDLGFFNDRILLNTEYYINSSSNQLLSTALSIVTGFTSIAQNLPASVQNRGWEFSLNTANIRGKDFKWTSNFNLTIPRNKLMSFPGLAGSSYANTYVVGQPITAVRLFHLLGVDPTTGKYQFADKNGNPTYTPVLNTDNTTMVDLAPRFYGGFQNSFSYKHFQLDVLFQFVKQMGMGVEMGYLPGYFSLFNNGNQPVGILNAWKKAGDVASIQRTDATLANITQWTNASSYSDAAYSDASYIRLKNLSLSWQLPDSWIKKATLKNARLYLQGQNLLTITSYKGLDPETLPHFTGAGSLPPLQVITAGVQVTF